MTHQDALNLIAALNALGAVGGGIAKSLAEIAALLAGAWAIIKAYNNGKRLDSHSETLKGLLLAAQPPAGGATLPAAVQAQPAPAQMPPPPPALDPNKTLMAGLSLAPATGQDMIAPQDTEAAQ